MKTKILNIALIGIFAFTLFSLPSCNKESNDLASTEVNQSDDLKKGKKARPLKGQIVYTEDLDITVACECAEPSIIGGLFSGTGNLTHLGKTYSESFACVTFIYCEDCPEEPDYIIGYTMESQCTTQIAANGDELWIEYDPYIAMIDFDCFCQFTGTTTGTITGGTGRFENASGSVEVYVVNDIVNGIVTAKWDGEITY